MPYRRFQHRWWLHILLFGLTVATTATEGALQHAGFVSDFGTHQVALGFDLIRPGLVYSACVLGILMAHEMGHYLMCRWYQVDATLPFFLPFLPILSLTGTLGAVIKIREMFPNKKALFDIAVAGPIAGFVALVPLLFIGLKLSNVLPVPQDMQGWTLGEPLLFKFASWLVFGTIRDGYSVNIHPMALAAWFGMLATAWNLLPFGQLDGGHLTFATLGDRSRYISMVMAAIAVGMCFVSANWILMAVLMLIMLRFFGSRHPPVLDPDDPLGPGRKILAVVALLMLIACFTPVPIDPVH